jgi:hypothetical protein
MKAPEIKIRKGLPFYFLASFEKKEDAKKCLKSFVNSHRLVGHKKIFCIDLSNKFSQPCYALYAERISPSDKDYFHKLFANGTN